MNFDIDISLRVDLRGAQSIGKFFADHHKSGSSGLRGPSCSQRLLILFFSRTILHCLLRISVLHSRSAKTVLRGGFGLFYQQPSGEDQSNSSPPGYSISQTLIAQTVKFHRFSNCKTVHLSTYFRAPGNRNGAISEWPSITWWQYNARQAYSEEWHISLQRQLGSETAAQISYVGSAGRHLANIDSNQFQQINLGRPRTKPTHSCCDHFRSIRESQLGPTYLPRNTTPLKSKCSAAIPKAWRS